MGVDLVDAAGPFGPVGHQPGVLEHPEVLGNGRPAHRQSLGQFADRARPGGQALEDLASGGVGYRREGAICVSHGLP